jgi:hypothetical protein
LRCEVKLLTLLRHPILITTATPRETSAVFLLHTQNPIFPRCDAAMPICISCRHPIPTLYTTYSKADDRALGKGVRLTQCPNCKGFADKYVEHDFVVLFIDLVLIKPEVRLTPGRMERRASHRANNTPHRYTDTSFLTASPGPTRLSIARSCASASYYSSSTSTSHGRASRKSPSHTPRTRTRRSCKSSRLYCNTCSSSRSSR